MNSSLLGLDNIQADINITIDPKSAAMTALAIFIAVFMAFMMAYFVFFKKHA